MPPTFADAIRLGIDGADAELVARVFRRFLVSGGRFFQNRDIGVKFTTMNPELQAVLFVALTTVNLLGAQFETSGLLRRHDIDAVVGEHHHR